MTSKRVMAGFAAGAAIAGMVVGAARLGGLADRATAAADEPAAGVEDSARANPPPGAPARRDGTGERERWRKAGASSDVPAGVLARVASRRELERSAGRCPAARDEAGVRALEAERCAPESGGVESVEIDWNGSSATP
jgi:hypothetical protein